MSTALFIFCSFLCISIELFSLYVLFFQWGSGDKTLENYFFQIWSYWHAYVPIIYEKTKTHIQAKEVYYMWWNQKFIHLKGGGWALLNISLTIDCYWKSIPIDNHMNLHHQLVINYQYQSINWYLLVLIDIDWIPWDR